MMSGCIHEKPLSASQATDIILTVKWVHSEYEIPRNNNDWRTTTVGAAEYFDLDGKRYCTVYLFKPYNDNDFKALNTLGHEILHCTDGAYHGRYKSTHDDAMDLMR